MVMMRPERRRWAKPWPRLAFARQLRQIRGLAFIVGLVGTASSWWLEHAPGEGNPISAETTDSQIGARTPDMYVWRWVVL